MLPSERMDQCYQCYSSQAPHWANKHHDRKKYIETYVRLAAAVAECDSAECGR